MGRAGYKSYSYCHTHHKRRTGVNLTWHPDGWGARVSPSVRLSVLGGGGRTGNGQGLGLRKENKAWAHKGLQRL